MWKTVKLNEIVNIDIGKTPSRSNPKYWDKNKKDSNVWVSIRDMSALKELYVDDSREYISNEGAKLFKEVPKNTLIMSFKLSIGKLAITKINLRTNEAIAAFKIKDTTLVYNEYLYYFLSSMNWDRIAGHDIKVKGKTLNKAKLREILIILPSLAEQQRIVTKLDVAFAEIDKVIKLTEVKDNKLEKLNAALIYSTLSGKDLETIKLGDVIDIVMGQAPPGKKCNKNGDGIPFVKAGEFRKISPVIREWTTEPKKHGKKSDVFLCVVGATCGKINYGTDCAIGRSVAALRPNCHKLNQRFLYYFMSQKVQHLRSGSKGAAQTVISKDMINNLLVFLPSLTVQKQIVSKLDTVVTEIDSIKDAVTKSKLNYKKTKLAILKKELLEEVT
jgi:type I restriction enzyme, S subunit